MKRIALVPAAVLCATLTIGAGTKPLEVITRSAVTVRATVNSDCTLQAPRMIDFGTYDPGANATVDATVDALQIACTKGSPGVSIALDNGQYYTGTHRAMKSLGGTGSVFYEIYTTSSRQVIWNRSQTVTYVSAGVQPSRIQLYGRVLGSQSPAPGDYSDTLMAMLNF